MIDEPSLGEVVRRLDEVSRRLDEVSARLEERAAQLAADFVRKDVFEERQRTDDVLNKAMENELHSLGKRLDAQEERRRTDRALVFSALIAPFIVALITGLLLGRVS